MIPAFLPRDPTRQCRALALFVFGVLGSNGCTSEPSAESLKATLVDHPDIIYATIQAHPNEFLDVLNGAAQAAQSAARQRRWKEDSVRIEGEFRNPKVPVIQKRAVFGNPAAPITIVEYADFECPYCRSERDTLVQLFKGYGDRIRLVVKHLPLSIHPHAMHAALMFEAIASQNPLAAYRFYDELYEHQEELTAKGEPFLEIAAARAGANVRTATDAAKSSRIHAIVEADIAEARAFGFTGTPGFLINGVSLRGTQPVSAFTAIIDRQLNAMR